MDISKIEHEDSTNSITKYQHLSISSGADSRNASYFRMKGFVETHNGFVEVFSCGGHNEEPFISLEIIKDGVKYKRIYRFSCEDKDDAVAIAISYSDEVFS